MDPSVSCHDVVQFEIPTLGVAERLCDLLADGWAAWIQHDQTISVVFVALNSDALDLAVLLRVVENWIEAESLCAIRYEVDDRVYVLEAGQPRWSALEAA